MEKLDKVYASPTPLDGPGNYMGETPDNALFVLLGRNRDSDILTESNWDCALELLGGEGENVEIHRFGHWVCGWLEYLCVRENTKEFKVAQEIESEIEAYPILNEDHFSEKESEEADRIWADCYDGGERVEYMRKNPDQFDFMFFSDMLACAKGKFFCGWASELIN